MAVSVGGIRPNGLWQNDTGGNPGGWGHSAAAPLDDVTDNNFSTYAYYPVNYPGYGGGGWETYALFCPLTGVPNNRNIVIRSVTFWSYYTTDNYSFQSVIWNGGTAVSGQGYVGNGWQPHTWTPAKPVRRGDLDLRVGWQVNGTPWGPQYFRVGECYVDLVYDRASRISMVI